MSRTRILFVCMGNICRSPLAEGIFLHLARRRGIADRFEIGSAGTGGWHAGERADPRARAVAAARGIELASRARQVSADDFDRFDHLVCMDEDNLEDLERRGAPASKLRLLLECDPRAPVRSVPDPYMGDEQSFQEVFAMIETACAHLLEELAPAVR